MELILCRRDQTLIMSIATDGKIKQAIVLDTRLPDSWGGESSILSNLHVLSATNFKALTCIDLRDTPITAEKYEETGYPFFNIYNESSDGIAEDFAMSKVSWKWILWRGSEWQQLL